MNKLLPFFLFTISIINAQYSNRYIDSTFTYKQILTNEIYATAPELNSPYSNENSTHEADLKFHLFAPEQDTLTKRPLLISIHGGAFLTGNKDHDDMIEFCKIFAKKGYVTATIQYRIGMYIIDINSSERAVYRGLQDGRAAIRYFRENAKVYGIDTNNIYMLGSSAGAFVALHNLYMNEESERPTSSSISPDLGALDAVNSDLENNGQANGVIGLWGALKDTTLIKLEDTNIPVFLVHGTNDKTVSFEVASPFGLGFLPATYGSESIEKRLSNLGQTPKTYFVDGEDHEFYGVSNGNWSPSPNAYWDTVVTKVSDFLLDIHKPVADFIFAESNQSINFTDKSLKATNWYWDFGDSTFSTLQNPEHAYQQSGIYKVLLTVQSSVSSWDTISSVIDYSITGVEEEILAQNFGLDQNYPNPFNPTTNISYSIPQSGNVIITIYDVLGNEITNLMDEYKSAGNYKIVFNAKDLSSGIYFYTLKSNNFVQSKKMILLK